MNRRRTIGRCLLAVLLVAILAPGLVIADDVPYLDDPKPTGTPALIGSTPTPSPSPSPSTKTATPVTGNPSSPQNSAIGGLIGWLYDVGTACVAGWVTVFGAIALLRALFSLSGGKTDSYHHHVDHFKWLLKIFVVWWILGVIVNPHRPESGPLAQVIGTVSRCINTGC